MHGVAEAAARYAGALRSKELREAARWALEEPVEGPGMLLPSRRPPRAAVVFDPLPVTEEGEGVEQGGEEEAPGLVAESD